MISVAKINEDNVVVDVLALPDESAQHYSEYLVDVLGLEGTWKKAEVSEFLANNAQVGYVYLPDINVFLAPKPFESWQLATTKNGFYYWNAPVEHPADGNDYYWDEETLSWVAE